MKNLYVTSIRGSELVFEATLVPGAEVSVGNGTFSVGRQVARLFRFEDDTWHVYISRGMDAMVSLPSTMDKTERAVRDDELNALCEFTQSGCRCLKLQVVNTYGQLTWGSTSVFFRVMEYAEMSAAVTIHSLDDPRKEAVVAYSSFWDELREFEEAVPQGQTWPSIDVNGPTRTYWGEGALRVVFLTTCWDDLSATIFDASVPLGAAIIDRATLAPAHVIRRILRNVQDAQVPLKFVGNLTPYDLTIFLSFRAVGEEMGMPAERIQWAGVSERWIDACMRALIPLEHLTKDLNGFEREHLSWLAARWDLTLILDETSLKLLQTGKKVEFESACSPNFDFLSRAQLQSIREFLLL